MAISGWAIAGIGIGIVAVVAIGYAVSSSGTAALPPPGPTANPDSVGANIGDAIGRAAPGIFAGIRSLSGGGPKVDNGEGFGTDHTYLDPAKAADRTPRT